MTESELKAAFAAFLIDTPNDPFGAALKLFPSEQERGEACRITFAWPNDPEVIIEMERLKKSGHSNKNIPTKEKVIEQLWQLAQSDRTPPKDRVAMARLVAEMLAYIPRPSDGTSEAPRMPTAPVYRIVTE